MALKIERRYIEWDQVEATEVRAADGTEKRIIKGYAARFNQLSVDLGGWREKILPGAFSDSLRTADVIFSFWNHNSDIVLGDTRSGNLTLKEDEKGLRFELELDTDIWSEYAHRKIKSGQVKGMSFGFRVAPGGSEWNYNSDKQLERSLKKVSLSEVSPTPLPAYPSTDVSARAECRSYEEILKEGMDSLELPVVAQRNLLLAAKAKLRLIGAC